jgi:DNA-binding LytR/AlgR family response regulator
MEDLKELFIQVHQGFAVNPTKISMISRDAVVLEDGTSVMMSLRKRKETLECYKKRMNIFQ